MAEGVCHLHFRQAVEGEEGMPLYRRDAVALGNLTVPQRNGSTSVKSFNEGGGEQITAKMLENMEF